VARNDHGVTKILVVDDDSVDRDLARRCLPEVDDLEVIFAADGREALEAVERDPPDLIVTDLRMPGLTGLELVEKLAEERPSIPVILMTSQGNEQTAVRALHAGAASYVPKRDLAETLADTVEQILMVVEARRSRTEVLRFLDRLETRFELTNDPALITSLVAYMEDNLERLGFADRQVRAQVGISLMEALANAMLHGNLEVDPTLRRVDRDAFDKQVRERRNLEPYASRRVLCEAHESPRRVEYTISDEGAGFDSSQLPDPTDSRNLLSVGGRGVMLMKTFMDEVTFGNNGSRVTLIKNSPQT
jgi:CheY-like chemotaxis protein